MKGRLSKHSKNAHTIDSSKSYSKDNHHNKINHSFTNNKHNKTETLESNSNDSKYNLKTLFMKNLNATGETFKKPRSNSIYTITQSSYTLTSPSNQINPLHKASKVPSEEQIRKRLKKPFNYSFKHYLQTKLHR